MVVVPRGVCRRRLYAAAVISLALGLWGLLGHHTPAVRGRVSPWPVVGDAARHHWRTLARWAVAGARGHLFSAISVPVEHDRRAMARRLATTLMGFAPPGDRHCGTEGLLYLGGAHAV
jgi:hypothetical protein